MVPLLTLSSARRVFHRSTSCISRWRRRRPRSCSPRIASRASTIAHGAVVWRSSGNRAGDHRSARSPARSWSAACRRQPCRVLRALRCDCRDADLARPQAQADAQSARRAAACSRRRRHRALSSMVGAGGAFISVPFMTACNVDIRKCVATSAALGLPIASPAPSAIFRRIAATGLAAVFDRLHLPAGALRHRRRQHAGRPVRRARRASLAGRATAPRVCRVALRRCRFFSLEGLCRLIRCSPPRKPSDRGTRGSNRRSPSICATSARFFVRKTSLPMWRKPRSCTT